MSMEAKARELAFQNYIIDALATQGWLVGESASSDGGKYDKERALYPEDLLAYVRESQPAAWEGFCRIYPQDTDKHLLNAVVRHLEHPDKGTLCCCVTRWKTEGQGSGLPPLSPTMGSIKSLLAVIRLTA